MATISSPGLGSGLDVNSLVTKLMAVEQAPLTALDTKEAGFQAKISALGTLKSAVSSVQNAAAALTATSLYGTMSASSSDSTILSASASTAAQAGSYSINVVARAQAQSISSQGFANLTSDIAAADGKIKIELGTTDAGVFTPDGTKTAVTISIAAGTSSLNDIRDAINAANAGVKANLVYVNDTVGYKLTLTSNSLGAKSSLKITTMDSNNVVINDNTGLAKLSFDPAASAGAGKEFDVNVLAQDAHLKIDGLDVYRASNSIGDVITGLTLNLAGTGTSSLTVSKSSATASAAIDTFVKAYNDLNKQLTSLTAYNSQTKKGAILTGDSGARSLQSAMRSMVIYSRYSPGSAYSSLSNLGVTLQRDGSLTYDSAKFTAAANDSNTTMADLMASTSTSQPGLAVNMNNALKDVLATSGILASRTDGINRSIADITRQRTRLQDRLTQIEKGYRSQFTRLDTLVSSMQQTSSYLTQQLATLQAQTSSSK